MYAFRTFYYLIPRTGYIGHVTYLEVFVEEVVTDGWVMTVVSNS